MGMGLLDKGLGAEHFEGDDVDDLDAILDDEGSTETGFGTSSIISTFNTLHTKPTNNVFDCVVVNVATIIRNCMSKDKSEMEIEKTLKGDLLEIMQAVARYHEQMGPIITTPMLIFYLPDYSYLPAIHARPMTGNRETIFNIVNNLIDDENLRKRRYTTDQELGTRVLIMFAGGKVKLPYNSIRFELSKLHSLGGADPRSSLSNYLLISHVPLDYYFLVNYPRTTLLESFSGRFLKPIQLGSKVFGVPYVPMNSVTHLLFGDKVLVKPMAQRKNRKFFFDLAARQSWNVRTRYEIAKFVEGTGHVPSQILLHVSF